MTILLSYCVRCRKPRRLTALKKSHGAYICKAVCRQRGSR
jgi:hypothetical protein